MEAGSSRRSSTSELPSSPLTGGRDEAEAEEVISRKRLSVKSASSSKSMFENAPLLKCIMVSILCLSTQNCGPLDREREGWTR